MGDERGVPSLRYRRIAGRPRTRPAPKPSRASKNATPIKSGRDALLRSLETLAASHRAEGNVCTAHTLEVAARVITEMQRELDGARKPANVR